MHFILEFEHDIFAKEVSFYDMALKNQLKTGADVFQSSLELKKIRILCYGDSNTWGYNPENGFRYPPESKWPRVMRTYLPEGWIVIEAGLPGRTTDYICLRKPIKNWGDPLLTILSQYC